MVKKNYWLNKPKKNWFTFLKTINFITKIRKNSSWQHWLVNGRVRSPLLSRWCALRNAHTLVLQYLRKAVGWEKIKNRKINEKKLMKIWISSRIFSWYFLFFGLSIFGLFCTSLNLKWHQFSRMSLRVYQLKYSLSINSILTILLLQKWI